MESLQSLWQRYRVPILVGVGIGILIMLVFFGVATWQEYDRGEFIALLQLIVEILMVPVTVFGFLFVVHEFQKSEREPDVDLYFEGLSKEIGVIKPRIGERGNPRSLVLYNSGQAIARWYSVELILPEGFTNFPNLPTYLVMWSLPDKWLTPEEHIATFRSDGTDAIYLNHPVHLVDLYFLVNSEKSYQEVYEIPYKIANDWGKPKEGKLRVRVIEEAWLEKAK